ncbi:uncharacterized protein LOC131657989 [Vicia villosa]|uniref:uncharacterized protein LOC131657989 n=1 Tax=Vicia villosa TaxID=3911 RepID=UPI00273C77AB|nr:uncharacterized protein LOC131657989 [Vicia villosa]
MEKNAINKVCDCKLHWSERFRPVALEDENLTSLAGLVKSVEGSYNHGRCVNGEGENDYGRESPQHHLIEPLVNADRELGLEALKQKEIVDFLKTVGLMKTVSELGPCYTKLVKKFIVNLSADVKNEESQEEYMRVFVRGLCVKFSPKVINAYFGRSKSAYYDDIPSLDQIATKITANWKPTNQKSTITLALAKLIFQIGIKAKINFSEFVFEQTMRHAESFALKLPIAFSYIILGIILKHHPDIMNQGYIKGKKVLPLTFNRKLFIGTRVPIIVMPQHKSQIVSGSFSHISKAIRNNLLLELNEISTALQEAITTCITIKENVYELIKTLSKKKEDDKAEEIHREEEKKEYFSSDGVTESENEESGSEEEEDNSED